MLTLFIHATNSKFRARDDGAEYESPAAAMTLGVRGAVGVLVDEINNGERNSAVEVSIAAADGVELLRCVVALSVCSLMVGSNVAGPGVDD